MAPTSTTSRSKRLGDHGEHLAARWYQRHGYRVVDRNWRCRYGELDLVLTKGDELVFCEVKTRSSRRFGHPAEHVTAAKQARIRGLSMRWMDASGVRAKYLRFDVAAVEGATVDVVKAAF